MASSPFHIPTSEFFKNQINFTDSNAPFKVREIMVDLLGHSRFFFVPSCFSALELAAYATQFDNCDEVIIPSFTHVSVANAFQRAGANLVFTDSSAKSMNMDIESLCDAITPNTKAIVFVHYAGNPDNFDAVKQIAREKNITLIEDAAQGIDSFLGNSHLGTMGDFGCISFDYQKNIECGQGGLLIVNNPYYLDVIHELYHNGTNQVEFKRGKTNFFEWNRLDGGNYRMSDFLFPILLSQLENLRLIKEKKIIIAQENVSFIEKYIPNYLSHFELNKNGNAQTNWILMDSEQGSKETIKLLKSKNINVQKHYYPLHLSQAGRKYSFHQSTGIAELSKDLIRLPNFLSPKIIL